MGRHGEHGSEYEAAAGSRSFVFAARLGLAVLFAAFVVFGLNGFISGAKGLGIASQAVARALEFQAILGVIFAATILLSRRSMWSLSWPQTIFRIVVSYFGACAMIVWASGGLGTTTPLDELVRAGRITGNGTVFGAYMVLGYFLASFLIGSKQALLQESVTRSAVKERQEPMTIWRRIRQIISILIGLVFVPLMIAGWHKAGMPGGPMKIALLAGSALIFAGLVWPWRRKQATSGEGRMS